MSANELELLHTASAVSDWVKLKLSILNGANQQPDETDVLIAAGKRLLELGDHGAAIDHFRRALDLCNSIPDKRKGIECHIFLANCYRKRNDGHTSLHLAQEALEEARAIQFTEGIALAQLAAGRDLAEMHRTVEARIALAEAKQIFTMLGDMFNFHQAELTLGTMAAVSGEFDIAEEKSFAAYQYFHKHEHEMQACLALNNLTGLMFQRRDLVKAREYMEQCLTYSLPRTSTLILIVTYNLGLLDVQERKLDKARQHLNRALLLARELRHLEAETNVLSNLAVTELLSSEFKEALYYSKLAVLRAETQPKIYTRAVTTQAVVRLASGQLAGTEDLPANFAGLHQDDLWQLIMVLQAIINENIAAKQSNPEAVKAQAERWLVDLRTVHVERNISNQP